MKWNFSIGCFILFIPFSYSQTEANDCTGAIEVCGDGILSSNASGFGVQEIDFSNSCSSLEHNSLWIKIQITKSGTLGFNLVPISSSIDIDYDFFIYGPNSSCGDLGDPIRCSTTNPLAAGLQNNHTGLNDSERDFSEGPGPKGNSFVQSLDVSPGETYFIVIDRPVGESPFELEWTGTSTTGSSPFPEGVEANAPADMSKCGINGVAEFDVFQNKNEITTQSGVLIEYYENFTEAIDQKNPIVGNLISTVPRKTIFVRVENEMTGCFEVVEFDLVILEEIPIAQEVIYTLCDWDSDGTGQFDLEAINIEILNGLSSANFTISYFLTHEEASDKSNPVSSPYTSSEGKIFARVEEVGNPQCFNISEIELKQDPPGDLSREILENIKVSSVLNSIFIVVPNSGNFEFSLVQPDGPYQKHPQFKELSSGEYTVFIRSLVNCEISSFEVFVRGFRDFFTPNNDGHNDFWTIEIPEDQVGAEPLKIFDRYGKLLIEIKPDSTGWDGKVGGKMMPADDYWFELKVLSGEVLRGNFSLVK